MSDALSALVNLSAHDYSWLAQFFSLLFLPFAHEDLAIIFGAYVVVNDVMPRHSASHCVASALAKPAWLRHFLVIWCRMASYRCARRIVA